ncbi:DinB family protein [Pedobacter punctiformis]|uniref:DinB family protein n=1 Tax=Pedobacter punctiformis TaxID=3004097 RepID=A0ABT4LBT6_9SPHI|nr:DinB family protein [Pedobacter sp. HCMS5-2]MCZ4244274.1 DinB family protein [Pedobacter sp. HCMS5-2]
MEKVYKEVDDALTALQTLFDGFSQEQINAVPFEGSWTAGQLAKHMIMANGGFTAMLNGPVEETNRPADQAVAKIKEDFENFSIRMEAPSFVVPPLKDYDKQELIQKLNQIKLDIIRAVSDLDLTKTTTSWQLPGYGYLTRLEAVYFVTYHTKRHIRQLEKMHNKLNSDYSQ